MGYFDNFNCKKKYPFIKNDMMCMCMSVQKDLAKHLTSFVKVCFIQGRVDQPTLANWINKTLS